MRKHYVTFYSPGTFVHEQSSRPIGEWDPAQAAEMAPSIEERYGAKPFGFVFTTRLTADPVPDGEGGLLAVEEKEIARSGMYFLGGRLRTYDEVVADDDPKEEILRRNMRANRIWIICENTNSWKSANEFKAGDSLLDSNGETIKCGDAPDLIAYRAEKARAA